MTGCRLVQEDFHKLPATPLHIQDSRFKIHDSKVMLFEHVTNENFEP